MKYYLDTEFIEGTQKTIFGETNPTIDLISIGLVDENGREFYTICKDFNLKEAWSRWQEKECCKVPSMCGSKTEGKCEGFKREYWIRDNVLRPIYEELLAKEKFDKRDTFGFTPPFKFEYGDFKKLLEKHGQSQATIANNICAFIFGDDGGCSGESEIEMAMKYEMTDKTKNPEFYGYFSDYDWVVFCWLFGKMNQLPKGFPYYCRDLKQIMDEKGLDDNWKEINCPTPTDEHNSLADAKWNLKLHNTINNIENVGK